jgi:hypothetical protein
MESATVMEELFDKKILQILSVFYDNEEAEFNLLEISKKSKVSLATTHRTINKLVKLNILEIRNIKHLKLYILAKNKTTEHLKNIVKKDQQLLEMFIERIKGIPGLNKVIIQGKESKHKVNLLLIGHIHDKEIIRSAVYDIKEQHNFTITHLELAEDQYEQMSIMGLYNGEKKVIYEKKP